ncbi:uncharacterized protein LOC130512390 [Raphanus sativus]|uniref:Uncharacterized protein LOC108858999 n=1 Tax=Raphanus sativus TaxID=3726 RepID=A0A6J0NU73_RAPSA|nr:uncharacterized protein LOC108858999 [Raphanus sativus]XP_056866309.1 uncharacterized protein LOC130512390 [Raphanus sativus]
MEDHQEFEKPIFELHPRKARSSRNKKKNGLVESMNHHHYEEIFCYYGLRGSPKRTTTQKSLRIRKRLIRCGECGKGFRYEKCLRNHTQTMHSLEENKKKKKSERDLLCIFRSDVQRRKRSKRVSRYKKILPPPSVSSSSSTFAKDGELLQVAESLIMLSKSGHALFSNLEMNQTECEDEQKLVGKLADGSMSNRRSKELLGFLGDKKVMKEDESGQKQKQVGAESFGEQVRLERVSLDEMLKKAESDTGQKLGGQEAVFEASNAAASKGNNEHRCRVCERVFSTYQALGGHQTVHRMKNNSEKSKHEMQRRVSSRS